MNLYELADIIHRDIIVERYPDQGNRWTAQLRGVHVREGHMLTSAYGEGKTPGLAVESYTEIIRGKTLTLGPGVSTESITDFVCPRSMETTLP